MLRFALQHVWDAGLRPEANMTFTPEQMSRATVNVQHTVDLGFQAYNLNRQTGVDDFTRPTTHCWTCSGITWSICTVRCSHIALYKAFRATELRVAEGSCGAGKGFVGISPTGDFPLPQGCSGASDTAGRERPISGIERGWWLSIPSKTKFVACAVRPFCGGSCGIDNALLCDDFHTFSASSCVHQSIAQCCSGHLSRVFRAGEEGDI